MALDMDAIRRKRQEAADAEKDRKNNRGPGLYKPKTGHVGLYLAPPTEAMDGIPFIEARQHGKVGPANGTHWCLSYDNPLIQAPQFLDAIEKRNAAAREKGKPEVVIDGYCPTCADLGGEVDLSGFSGKRQESMASKPRYLCGVMEVGDLKDGRLTETPEGQRVFQSWIAPSSIEEQILQKIDINGDVTDPEAPIILLLENTGDGWDRYSVDIYVPSMVKPKPLSKPIKAALRKAQEEGGDLDLWRLAAAFCKSANQVEAMLRGAEVDHRAAPAEAEGKPQCFGADCDPSDPEWCQPCPFKAECSRACSKDLPAASDAVWPFDGKTWADRGQTDPAAEKAAAPQGRPTGRPAGKPAADPAPVVAKPAAAVPAVRTAAPAAAPAVVPVAAPGPTRSAPATPVATRSAPATRSAAPVAAPATRVAAPLPRASGAPAPVAAPKAAAVPEVRTAAPATRVAAKPAPAPDPDPEGDEDPITEEADDVGVGPGEEFGDDGAAGDDEIDSFEAELLAGR